MYKKCARHRIRLVLFRTASTTLNIGLARAKQHMNTFRWLTEVRTVELYFTAETKRFPPGALQRHKRTHATVWNLNPRAQLPTRPGQDASTD